MHQRFEFQLSPAQFHRRCLRTGEAQAGDFGNLVAFWKALPSKPSCDYRMFYFGQIVVTTQEEYVACLSVTLARNSWRSWHVRYQKHFN